MKAYVVLKTEVDPETNNELNTGVAEAFTTLAEARRYADCQPIPEKNGPKWSASGTSFTHEKKPVMANYQSGRFHMYIVEVTVNDSAAQFIPPVSFNVAAIRELAAANDGKLRLSARDVADIERMVGEDNLVVLPESTSFSYGYAVYSPETKERLCFFEKSRLPKSIGFKEMREMIFGTKRNLFVAKACGFPEIREEGHYEY
jgi:hypothetical protein